MGGPALMIVDNQGIFLADLLGFILSLPIAVFLAFWMSAVKRRRVVMFGAFIGSFVGFLVILGWVGTLIKIPFFPAPIPAQPSLASLCLNPPLALVLASAPDL